MRSALLLSLYALVGCEPDNNLTVLEPEIVVSPPILDFGDVVVEYSSTVPLEIKNDGQAPLTVSGIRFDGARSGAFSIGEDQIVVEKGEIGTVDITFEPPTYLPYTDTILVESDDPENPSVVVRLFGEGVDGPSPDIAVNAMSFEFEDVFLGYTDEQHFMITNEGEGDLHIDAVSIDGDGAAAFSLLDDIEGQKLTSGSSLSTSIVYEPDDETGESATLTLTSNDPDESPIEILLVGNGGGAFAFPVADFDCPTDVAPLDTVRFDGSASYDPNGYEPLEYYWTLVSAPEESTSELTQDESEAEILVDAAGDYSVGLIVQNSVGIFSDTELCTFEVIPSDKIHVELFWNTGESDLDLHMVRSGSEFFEEPGDVCYCNQNPEWGDTSSDADDPTLDIDVTTGHGPEHINIEDPAEDTYTIYVHYFLDNGGGPTTATVRIFLEGELAIEAYGLVENKEVWEVGTISWPDGTVTLSDADPVESTVRSCTKEE